MRSKLKKHKRGSINQFHNSVILLSPGGPGIVNSQFRILYNMVSRMYIIHIFSCSPNLFSNNVSAFWSLKTPIGNWT